MSFNYHKLPSTFLFLFCCFAFQSQAQNCITFTGLTTGTYAVTGGYPMGTPFQTETGLDVSLAAYHYPNGDVKNNVYVQAGEFFWSGLFINANTTYIKMLQSGIQMDFTEVESNKIAGSVTFDFLDWSGYVNLTINDNPVNVETTFSEMPSDIAPNVTMEIVEQNVGSGGKMGTVTLTGDISNLVIGAENFGIDNICFELKESTATAIKELSDDDVKIFTNQGSDRLYIQLFESTKRGQVAIYNTAGQLLMTDQLANGSHEKQYDLSALQAGIYICQIEVDGKLKNWKFSRY